MAKYKPCNYDQMVMLPISLESQLVPGSLEHTINELVEKHVDLSVFDERYKNDDTGASAIHPKVLLKIVLLAYARGLISSRQMERACLENITFMALACQHTPDHSTIANFVSSMQEEVESVFCNILLVCDQLGLLGGSHFSLDGVKLSANVSKEWSGTFEELKHKRDKLQEKLKQVMAEHVQADREPEFELERQRKRERRLQAQVERLNEFLAQNQPKIGSEGKEIQSNAVDNESVKMPHPTASSRVTMRRRWWIPNIKSSLPPKRLPVRITKISPPCSRAVKGTWSPLVTSGMIFAGNRSPPTATIIRSRD